MSVHEELKYKLRLAVIRSRKEITEAELDEATRLIEKKASVRKSDIEVIGESVTGDRQIFAATEIDDINNLLGRLGNK